MNAESILFHLACLEDDSARFYASLVHLTISMPKVQTLFSRLSQEENNHKNLVNLAKAYQSQASWQFRPHPDYTDEIQKARDTLLQLQENVKKHPPMPPFLPLLEDVFRFEQEMESCHYSTYLEINDDKLKELLLQLTQFDKQHVAMINRLIENIKESMQEGPES